MARLSPAALPELPLAPASELTEIRPANLPPLHEDRLVSDGYVHHLAWRARDGALFIVSTGGIAGQSHAFGPLNKGLSCLSHPTP